MTGRTLLLAGFAAWMCADAGFAAAPSGSLLDPAYRVVIPAGRVKSFLAANGCAPIPQGLADRISGVWTPDGATIAAADHKLPFALRQAIQATHWIGPVSQNRLTDFEVLANHARQYAGVMLQGKKRILVLAAPIYVVDFDGRSDLLRGNWQKTPVGACDGGPGQFFADYDPATGIFGDFAFTGTIAGRTMP